MRDQVIGQGPERFLPKLKKTTSRALGQQKDSDEMEGTGRKATKEEKEWEALVEENNPQACTSGY